MAFGIGEALSIGGSIAGGLFGDDANEDAASAIGASNEQIQKMIRDQQMANDGAFAPYRATGEAANNKLSFLLGMGGSPDGKSVDDKYTLTDFFNYGKYWRGKNGYNDLTDGQLMEGARQQYQEYLNGAYGKTAQDVDRNYGGKLRDIVPTDYSGAEGYGSLLKGFTNDDLTKDVVYNTGLQFGLDEGLKGLNRRAASGGSYDSGATLKALTRYANDYGTTKASGAYDRFMNDKNTTYNYLSGQQNVGLNATGNNQSLNTGLVNSAVGAQQNAASQQAQYGVQGAASLNNGIMGGIGNYLYGQRVGSGGVLSGGGFGSGTGRGGGEISLNGYQSSIPWYA
jgi:hypothetical protein